MSTYRFAMLALGVLILGSCTTRSVDYSPPPTVVYKTKGDYRENVPVLLSADRSSIISFPDPRDLYRDSKLTLPTRLHGGYLLDNRGVTTSVAFLRITYAEYGALKRAPDPAELMAQIIDRDPLVEMYNCGNRRQFREIEKELNEIISNGDLDEYRDMMAP